MIRLPTYYQKVHWRKIIFLVCLWGFTMCVNSAQAVPISCDGPPAMNCSGDLGADGGMLSGPNNSIISWWFTFDDMKHLVPLNFFTLTINFNALPGMGITILDFYLTDMDARIPNSVLTPQVPLPGLNSITNGWTPTNPNAPVFIHDFHLQLECLPSCTIFNIQALNYSFNGEFQEGVWKMPEPNLIAVFFIGLAGMFQWRKRRVSC